jgi:hypothetical protein
LCNGNIGHTSLLLAWLLPFCTAFVVLATSYFYVPDVLAGIELLWVAIRLTTWRRRSGAHRPGDIEGAFPP